MAFWPETPDARKIRGDQTAALDRSWRGREDNEGSSFLICILFLHASVQLSCPPERSPMNDPEIYLWRAAYASAVLEADSSLMSERILEALVAIARRLRTPILIDGPEHIAMKAAKRALASLKAQRVEIQSEVTVPLIWHAANRN
jgi:hypothetical protein